MRDDEVEHGVLVAVGPDGVRDGALELAAAEAVRLRTGVELLHVVHTPVSASASTRQIEFVQDALTRVGRKVLGDAADRMCAIGSGFPLYTRIAFGPVGRTIVHRAASGRLIIVERGDGGRLEHLLKRSVSTSVAAHVRVPVVVVPRGWTWHADLRPVTVGVDEPADVARQVAYALAFARQTHRPLVVLHAASRPAQPFPAAAAGHSPQRWVDEIQRELSTGSSEGGLGTTAGVELRCEVRWGRPADALVDATPSSSVLVLSRRAPRQHFGAHLGPITRAVLDHAQCPVVVVDRS